MSFSKLSTFNNSWEFEENLGKVGKGRNRLLVTVKYLKLVELSLREGEESFECKSGRTGIQNDFPVI